MAQRKFFWSTASGLNADIERHRKKRQELQEKIRELELMTDDMSVSSLRVYRHFLCQLEQSLADTVDKLGRCK